MLIKKSKPPPVRASRASLHRLMLSGLSTSRLSVSMPRSFRSATESLLRAVAKTRSPVTNISSESGLKLRENVGGSASGTEKQERYLWSETLAREHDQCLLDCICCCSERDQHIINIALILSVAKSWMAYTPGDEDRSSCISHVTFESCKHVQSRQYQGESRGVPETDAFRQYVLYHLPGRCRVVGGH